MPSAPSPAIHELTVVVPRTVAWDVAEALEEARPAPIAVGVHELSASEWRVWAHYAGAPEVDRAAAAVARALGAPSSVESVRVGRLPDVDWVARSQACLRPVRAGRFTVHGSHDRAKVGGRAFAIEIEAGRAFGTAHHASTRGCLIVLDDLLKRRRFARAVDIGTGSGVLAIAVARVQRTGVLAGDNDPVAVAVARDNARTNGVGRLVAAVEAAGFDRPRLRRAAPFDLVTANILARPLVALAPRVAGATRRGAVVVLSGLTSDQARQVAGAYLARGFALVRRLDLDGWATLALRRL